MSQEVVDFGWEKYLKEMDEDLSYVDVGILSKDGSEGDFPLAQLAAVQEFGNTNIPSRPYMRGTFDEQQEQLAKAAGELESQG